MVKRNTRQDLIEIASELIWRSSYGSVSVDDICKKADVKKGSFYHFFKSKAALAIAAMDHYVAQSQAIFDDAFAKARAPWERFSTLADHVLIEQEKAAKEYGHVYGCPFASLGSEMAGQEQEINDKINEIFAKYQTYYEDAIQDLIDNGDISGDIDVKARAAKIQNFAMGQATVARIQNSLEPFKRDLKIGWLRILDLNNKTLANEDKLAQKTS
jgi:TetR/AcrR family transcriptional repressor of nem operon